MDDGIKEKFFSDLRCLFNQKPEVDGPIQGFENVGLKRNQTDTSSEALKDLSSDGDDSTGNRNMQYPIRLEAEDCSFFIRTGTCKFGRTCKFNHPVSTIAHVNQGKSNRNGVGSFSKSLSRIPCKFYSSGFCKYGDSCRFNHSKSEPEKSFVQLNILGLPERLGKRNCSFYMRTGICGYGPFCRFNHPNPIFFTVESMDDQKPSFQSHERVLKFGSFPCEFNGYQGKKESSTDGSTLQIQG